MKRLTTWTFLRQVIFPLIINNYYSKAYSQDDFLGLEQFWDSDDEKPLAVEEPQSDYDPTKIINKSGKKQQKKKIKIKQTDKRQKVSA